MTKDEDPDQVFEALSNLEKLMREKCKAEADAAQRVLDNLNGSWRLVFSTYKLCKIVATMAGVHLGLGML
jgi:hypothetical protein